MMILITALSAPDFSSSWLSSHFCNNFVDSLPHDFLSHMRESLKQRPSSGRSATGYRGSTVSRVTPSTRSLSCHHCINVSESTSAQGLNFQLLFDLLAEVCQVYQKRYNNTVHLKTYFIMKIFKHP